MTRRSRLARCLALVALACRPGSAPDVATDRVVMVKESDPEMRVAIARARSRLPEFWRELDTAGQERRSFAVKVPVTDAHGTEYFWLVDVSRASGRVSGTINNEPNIVKSVKENQRLDVAEAEIADWMYLRGGKMYGNFTLRPLLKTLPPGEARKLEAMLAEP